ncbi:MAG: biotin transporter BioY, partial [Oscillospiraceae bacterium]|nr:biotin transporter BioY [Oscillospiraceae bacterium]
MKSTQNTKTKQLVLSGLLAAFTAVLAQIVLPVGPVPFNLALLGAYLAGMLLPPAAALGSMAVYCVLGAFGVPVFAGFAGGP